MQVYIFLVCFVDFSERIVCLAVSLYFRRLGLIVSSCLKLFYELVSILTLSV